MKITTNDWSDYSVFHWDTSVVVCSGFQLETLSLNSRGDTITVNQIYCLSLVSFVFISCITAAAAE